MPGLLEHLSYLLLHGPPTPSPSTSPGYLGPYFNIKLNNQVQTTVGAPQAFSLVPLPGSTIAAL